MQAPRILTAAVFSDEYRILVDMRWNKQYLDILASKCNFEDEERYMDFLEALNTVANRYVCSWDPVVISQSCCVYYMCVLDKVKTYLLSCSGLFY